MSRCVLYALSCRIQSVQDLSEFSDLSFRLRAFADLLKFRQDFIRFTLQPDQCRQSAVTASRDPGRLTEPFDFMEVLFTGKSEKIALE